MRPGLTPAYLVRYCASVLVFYSGLAMLYRVVRRLFVPPRALILAYHGFRSDLPFIEMFMPPEVFRKQVAYLNRVYEVMSLGEYVATRQTDVRRRRDVAVITADDGYADNHAVMIPIVRELGIRMTVFVTTDCVSSGSPTTVAALMVAINTARVPVLQLPEYGLPNMPIATRREKERALVALDRLGKESARQERDQMVARVLEACGTSAAGSGAARFMLSWDQVREMHRCGIEIGGHSQSHAVLSRLGDGEVAKEIDGSLEVISLQLGVAADLFAYPYGGSDEVDSRVIRICGEGRARAAVTLVNESPDKCPIHALGRDMMTVDRCMTPWGTFSRALFAIEVSGITNSVRAAIWNLRRGRGDGERGSHFNA
jgi:peptidoglycan/xylan/chitin deacetylase (PgdA/CDA1 family)